MLVAHDQAPVRQALRLTLDSEPDIEVVDEAANSAEAVRKALWRRPDVVVMDLRLPYLDGVVAIRQLTGTESPGNCRSKKAR
ncbi:response regulator [Nonomuraea sediminis]|uniref:response regulator n=1 Tax=Nonomuraea sediminis TaxID=2835864 RepID=UPI001BDC0DC5|nr:response regulator transcription factor [Nonomuraea sediminis]